MLNYSSKAQMRGEADQAVSQYLAAGNTIQVIPAKARAVAPSQPLRVTPAVNPLPPTRKKQPNITNFFKQLGAPLKNYRWSWGAVSQEGSQLFLRVWGHEIMELGGKTYVQVTNHALFSTRQHLGYRERLQHVAIIEKAISTYCVICVAKDTSVQSKKVKDFNSNAVRRAGAIIEYQGNEWLQLLEPVATTELLRIPSDAQ